MAEPLKFALLSPCSFVKMIVITEPLSVFYITGKAYSYTLFLNKEANQSLEYHLGPLLLLLEVVMMKV